MDEFGEGRVDYLDPSAAAAVNHERPLKDYTSKVKKRRAGMDIPFLLLTLVILAIGVVMVLSASFARSYYTEGNPTYYFMRQLGFAALGVIVMLLLSRLPMSFYRKMTVPVFLASLLLLIAVLFIGIGEEESGARRWINLGFTTFQPSEAIKIAEIMLFAVMVCNYRDKMKTFKYGVLPFAVVVAVICFLLYKEPHLSAAVIVIAIAVAMMFAGGTKSIWFIIGLVAIAVIGVLIVTKMSYANARITSWLHPEVDPLGDSYQTNQSLYAVGSGGLFGLGLGQGRQKYLYLPEEHNDFIFAIVCEELGFIGAVLVLALFALLIIRGFWLALHIRDRYGSLLVTGISSMLAIQVFLNVGVVTNLLPNTGIALPFFSYGGTALVMQLAEMGIVLAASRDIPLRKAG